MTGLIQELAFHAEGNVGDGCWDLYDHYKPLAEAGAVILLPGEQPPWNELLDARGGQPGAVEDPRGRE